MADGQTNGWLKSQYAGLKQFPGQRGMWGAAKPGSTVQPLKGVTGEPPLKGDSAESIQKYVDMDRPTAVQSDKAPISGEKSGMRDPDMTATPQAGTTAPLGQPQRMSPKDLVAARYGTPTTWRGRAQQMFGNAMDKLNPISNAGAADDVPQPNNPVPKPDNPTTDNRNVQSDAAKEADAYDRSVQAGAGMRGTVTPSVTNPKSIPASTASSGGTSWRPTVR